MARKRLLQLLGSPLTQAEGFEETIELKLPSYFEKPQSFLYEGVYTWVDFTAQERVLSIRFDLRKYKELYGGRQQLLLLFGGATYLLDERTTRQELRTLMQSRRGKSRIRVQGSAMVLLDTATTLGFDAYGRLYRLDLTFQ